MRSGTFINKNKELSAPRLESYPHVYCDTSRCKHGAARPRTSQQ
jgi:hypothetical protein